jgi:hypothetical protein
MELKKIILKDIEIKNNNKFIDLKNRNLYNKDENNVMEKLFFQIKQ